MSHVVKCKVEMKNQSILEKAMEHLGLKNLGVKTHELYGGQSATGLGMSLPGWNFPVVVNLENGEAAYDNYNGSWGKQVELDKLVQRYSIEAALEQAVLSGYTVDEQQLENGDVELNMYELAGA